MKLGIVGKYLKEIGYDVKVTKNHMFINGSKFEVNNSNTVDEALYYIYRDGWESVVDCPKFEDYKKRYFTDSSDELTYSSYTHTRNQFYKLKDVLVNDFEDFKLVREMVDRIVE